MFIRETSDKTNETETHSNQWPTQKLDFCLIWVRRVFFWETFTAVAAYYLIFINRQSFKVFSNNVFQMFVVQFPLSLLLNALPT